MHDTYRRGELLRHLEFRSKIDAINFRAAKAPSLPKRHFSRAFGDRGFPLHDPDRRELAVIAAAPLVRLEVAIDAAPNARARGKLHGDPELSTIFMGQTFILLQENLFPWAGAGIPTDNDPWSFGADTGDRMRRWTKPTPRESFYFGRHQHSAQVKVYWKTRDQGATLPQERQSVRVELTLDEGGCRNAGLTKVGDLLDYGFRRKLRPYFHAIRPMLRPDLFRRAPGALGDLLWDRAKRELDRLVRDVGGHALRDHAWAYTGKNSAYAALNRRLGDALKDVI